MRNQSPQVTRFHIVHHEKRWKSFKGSIIEKLEKILRKYHEKLVKIGWKHHEIDGKALKEVSL